MQVFFISCASVCYADLAFRSLDNGRVMKVVNKGRGQIIKTLVIEVMTVFDDDVPITGLRVHRSADRMLEKLIVLSRDALRSIPLHQCHLKTTCRLVA